MPKEEPRGIHRLQRPNGRPRLSDQELLERERKRNSNPIRRISQEQRIALEALATGHSIEEAADLSGIPADELAARIYRPDMIRAIEAIRSLVGQRLRDAALYELACISGAIKGGRTPASEDEKVRLQALKSLVAECRGHSLCADTLLPYDEGEGNAAPTPDAPAAPPQLVLLVGEDGSQ